MPHRIDDPNCTIPLSSTGTANPTPASSGSRYRIVGPLGEGAMGVVYRAEDTLLGRTVAVKTIPAEMIANRPAKERFLSDARAASALDHANLCTVYEIDETADGRLCLLMPCYEGETLRSRLQRGPLPVREAIYIAQQAARGLAKAHSQEIVHGDIKPANLFLTADGVVKILDFGIARLAGETHPAPTGAYSTPRYRSPEQERGGEVDASSDIWSLGIVLYEMLTGRLPSSDEHGPAVAWKDSAELIRLLQEEAPELEDIIFRMLAWRPAHRYPHAAALLVDLDRLAGQPWARKQEPRTAPFKDRQFALAGFGFLEICIAVGCLVPSAMAIFVYLMNGPLMVHVTNRLWRLLAAPLLVCTAAMAFFACVGVGSIRARRWAGTLMLIASWIWLYCGVLVSAFAVYIDLAEQSDSLPPFCFYFLLMPALFVLFYSGRNVKATLTARDPKLRWTDRCPTPVLAAAFLLVLGAACSMLFAPLGHVSFFGRILTGGPAVTFFLSLGGVFISIAVALYRLRTWAWWVLLCLCIVGFIAGLLTPAAAPQASTPELWSLPPPIPPSPPGAITAVIIKFPDFSLLLWTLWSRSFIGFLVYLLWIKKYFSPRFRALTTRTPAAPWAPAILHRRLRSFRKHYSS